MKLYDDAIKCGLRFNAYLEWKLGEWGLTVAQRPWQVLLGTLFGVLVFTSGWLMINMEDDTSKLWVPQDTDLMQTRRWREEQYPITLYQLELLVAPKQKKAHPADVLQPHLVDELFQLHDKVIGLEVGGCTFNTCVCAVNCFSSGHVLTLWCDFQHFKQDVMDAPDPQAALLARVNQAEACDGRSLNPNTMLGQGKRTEGGEVVAAEALRVHYSTDDNTEWFHEVRDLVLDHNKNSKHLDFALTYNKASDEELAAVVARDIPLMVMSYNVMTVFLVCLLGRRDAVNTRVGFAVAGVLSVMLAILSSFGFAMFMGVPFTIVTQTLPFIILAIGVDDMLILVDSLDEVERDPTFEDNSLEQMFREVMRRGGTSVLMTSVTNVFAFSLGTATVIPAFQGFAAYACLAVLFDFLLQISFFLAAAVILKRRMIEGKTIWYDWCCCPRAQPASTASNKLQNISGEDLSADRQKWLRPHWVFWPVPVKISLVLAVLAVSAVSLVFVKDLKEGLPYKQLAADDSYLQDYYDLREATFDKHTGTILELHFRHLDQSDPTNQLRMVQAHSYMLAEAMYASPLSTENGLSSPHNWLTDLWTHAELHFPRVVRPCKELVPTMQAQCDESYAPQLMVPKEHFQTIFVPWIQNATTNQRFLMFEHAEHEDQDMALESKKSQADQRGDWYAREAEGTILASYFTLSTVKVDADDGEPASNDFFDVQSRINRDLFPENPNKDTVRLSGEFLTFSQMQVVMWDEAIQNLVSAGAGVVFICWVALVHPTMPLLITLGIFMIDALLFGEMVLLSIRFNSVSVIIILMAIGLSVDYSMHVMHSFLKIVGNSREERAYQALITTGRPILMGVCTTMLGVFPLAFATTVIFRTFFFMLFGVVLFSALVGLMIIPMLLSMVGPPPIFTYEEYKHASQSFPGKDVDLGVHEPSSGSKGAEMAGNGGLPIGSAESL